MELSLVFSHVTALAALGVVLVQQILKSKFIPLKFANLHPVPTNVVLSTVVAAYLAWSNKIVQPQAWTDWVILVAFISVLAAFIYRQTIANSVEVKSTEGYVE